MELNQKDLELFQSIIEISKAISFIYQKLSYLEMDDLKKSEGYNSLVDLLKKSKLEEEKLYNSLSEPNKRQLLQYLINSNKFDIDKDYFFTDACNKNSVDIWYYRILFKLDENKDIPKFNNKYLSPSIQEMMKNIDDPNEIQECLEMIDLIKEGRLREFINQEFEYAFIYFIEEEYNRCDNVFDKDYLLKIKYNFLLATPSLEDKFINNNFNNEDDLVFCFPMLSEYLGFEEERKQDIQLDEAYTFCKEAIEGLEASLIEEDEVDEAMEKNKFVMSIYFRAGLSLLYNRHEYQGIIDNISVELNPYDEEEMDYEDSDKINEFIEESIKNSTNDRVKCKYLSLRPNNNLS